MAMAFRGQSFLGVGVAEINAERAKALKLREERGVEITRVEENSPAAKAGLKVHDVVLEYQGQRVEGADQFIRLVRETPSGRSVSLVVSRDGQSQAVQASIGSRRSRVMGGEVMIPEFRFPDLPGISRIQGWSLGVEVEGLNPQLAEFFGVKDGVLVRSVLKDSAAEKAGVRAGDVITKAEGNDVTSTQQLMRAAREARSRGSLPLVVVREKREVSLTVRIDGDAAPVPPKGRVVRLQEW